jgi:hypothetical protein
VIGAKVKLLLPMRMRGNLVPRLFPLRASVECEVVYVVLYKMKFTMFLRSLLDAISLRNTV